MSTHGSGAHFAVNDGTTLQTLSTYITSTDWNPTQDTHDDTTYGNTGHTFRGGLTNGTITINGFWDKTATTGPDAVLTGLLSVKTPVAYAFGPDGNASGKVKKSGNCLLNSYSVSAPVADLVTFSAQFNLSGAVATGVFP